MKLEVQSHEDEIYALLLKLNKSSPYVKFLKNNKFEVNNGVEGSNYDTEVVTKQELDFYTDKLKTIIIELVNEVSYGFSIKFDIVNNTYITHINASTVVTVNEEPLVSLLEALVLYLNI
jgi:hypothetical protein